ncbi:MAG: hypothetical protein IJK62_08275 [Bacteroidales bacterium]|nr:hypothetical protein [Prevotella sp.]MBQ6276686.1 hypothetical protein [Bacteroidales bacterium]
MKIDYVKTIEELNQIKDDAFFTVLTSLSYEVLEKWANENQLHLFIRRNEDDDNLFYIADFDYLFDLFENDEFDTSDWDYSFNVFLQRWDWEILGNWSEDDV